MRANRDALAIVLPKPIFFMMALVFECLKSFAFFSTVPVVCWMLEPFGRGMFKDLDSFHLNLWTYFFLPFVAIVKMVFIFAAHQGLLFFNTPEPYASLLAATLYPLLSGHLHTDGFSDVQDALHAPHKKPEEVIYDPHVGALGSAHTMSLTLISCLTLALCLSKMTFQDYPSFLVGVAVVYLGSFVLALDVKQISQGGEKYPLSYIPYNVFNLNMGWLLKTYFLVWVALSCVVIWNSLDLLPLAGLGATTYGAYIIIRIKSRLKGFMNGDMLGFHVSISECIFFILAGVWSIS